MTPPKYNKFNTGKTKDYFPLKRWRFNTEKHPVIVSKDKCASSTAKTLFSTQELQMLVGLTNTLQCNQREAVRIALYEASISLHKAYNSAFRLHALNQRRKRIRDDPQRLDRRFQIQSSWQYQMQQKN